jgi:hypothetical protein
MLTLRPRELHETVAVARTEQKTDTWKTKYALRTDSHPHTSDLSLSVEIIVSIENSRPGVQQAGPNLRIETAVFSALLLLDTRLRQSPAALEQLFAAVGAHATILPPIYQPQRDVRGAKSV